jgi:hypothetical protein
MTDNSDFLRKLFADPEEERITLPAPTQPAPAETAARTFTRELFARSSED